MVNRSYPHVLKMPRSHVPLVKFCRDSGGCFHGKIVIEDIGLDMLNIECESLDDRAFLIVLREADLDRD